jgi:hypothetical protein
MPYPSRITTKYRPKENSTGGPLLAGTGASMLAFGSRRSNSIHAVSHRSRALRRSGRDRPGSSGSKTPVRAVRDTYWSCCELTMSSFSWRHVHRHAWISEGERLENISMRSSLESEKRGGGDIVGEDCGRSSSQVVVFRVRAPCLATIATARARAHYCFLTR